MSETKQFHLTLKDRDLDALRGIKLRQKLDEIINIQREGIEHGVRPGPITGDIPNSHYDRWKSRVWNHYLANIGQDPRKLGYSEGRTLRTNPVGPPNTGPGAHTLLRKGKGVIFASDIESKT